MEKTPTGDRHGGYCTCRTSNGILAADAEGRPDHVPQNWSCQRKPGGGGVAAACTETILRSMRRVRLPVWVVLPVVIVFVAALWRPTDADVHRYFAYCSAALGRPFKSFYVRSYEAWQGDFIAGTVGRPGDFPTVVLSRPLTPYR